MVLAPLSEFYGCKSVYIILLLVYVIWIIPCAVGHSPNSTLSIPPVPGKETPGVTQRGGPLAKINNMVKVVEVLSLYIANHL